MKTQKHLLLLACLLAAWPLSAAPGPKTETIKRFEPEAATISKELVRSDDKAWAATTDKAVTLRLFEIADPNVDDCMVIYRAKLKSEGLTEPAYLEMWCRLPGRGEFFSRGLQNTIQGTTDWSSFETPFFLKKGEKPDLIKLNVAMKGGGKIWIKDVEVLKTPLPK